MSYTLPIVFGNETGTQPSSQFDQNFQALLLGINRAYQTGLLANRPAAGTAGQFYFATDANGGTLYLDNGTAWVQIAAPITVQPQGGGTGATVIPANGQIPIGNGATYTPATLSAGQNIAVANTVGAITLSVSRVMQGFSASGTFTVPAGVVQIRVILSGGGGGGGGGGTGGSTASPANGNAGLDGQAGGVLYGLIPVTPAQVLTVTIGAGGGGGAGGVGSSVVTGNSGANGTNGGSTTLALGTTWSAIATGGAGGGLGIGANGGTAPGSIGTSTGSTTGILPVGTVVFFLPSTGANGGGGGSGSPGVSSGTSPNGVSGAAGGGGYVMIFY